MDDKECNMEALSIFTTIKAYPNGAKTLEFAVEKALSQAERAAREYKTAHGIIITPYKPGFFVDSSEKNINYVLSSPQIEITSGNCNCSVGNKFSKFVVGGGVVPTKRPISKEDDVSAVVICMPPYKPIDSNVNITGQSVSKKLGINVYVSEPCKRSVWIYSAIGKKSLYVS
jgi:hypothetical protein